MKKGILMTALASIIIMGASSCTKCKVCTKTNSPEIRVCEKDYNTSTQFSLAVDGFQASGYVCKQSI